MTKCSIITGNLQHLPVVTYKTFAAPLTIVSYFHVHHSVFSAALALTLW